jgi:putative tricarboxylic transport membrane protein
MDGFLSYLAATTSPGVLTLALVLGAFGGLIAGLTPGVSGRAGLLLVTPVAIGMGPVAGAAFLVSFHSVVHTSGSVPAILLGAPTSAAEAATVIDGYAMTRKGEGARAIGAALAASVVGGIIGALLLLGLAPAALGAASYLGSPEIAAISILGLLSISALAGGSMAGGLITAAMGLVIATIGIDPITGTARFTGGFAQLGDGVSAAALVTGLFVVPELAARHANGAGPPAQTARSDFAAVMGGLIETLRYRWLLLRTSALSAVVGMAPGLGAAVAVWIAYGHARQTEPSEVPYGEGAIAGVIAPEAANNAKEGGALAPTLFFGVPGSSGMGILLAAFMVMGVEVGPRMLTNTPEFITLLGLTIIAANLIAAPMCLLLLPAMARFAAIRPQAIAPVALTAGVAASLLTEPGMATLLMVAAFSILGLVLKSADLPRAPLLLGFVLAPGIETGLVRAGMIQGWEALLRPGVLLIAAIGVLAMAVTIIGWARRRGSEAERVAQPARGLPLALLVLGLLGLVAVFGLSGAPVSARVLPAGAGAIALTAAGLLAWRLRKSDVATRKAETPFDWPLLGMLAAMLAVVPLSGAPLAAAGFVAAALVFQARVGWMAGVTTGLLTGAAVFGLERLMP